MQVSWALSDHMLGSTPLVSDLGLESDPGDADAAGPGSPRYVILFHLF